MKGEVPKSRDLGPSLSSSGRVNNDDNLRYKSSPDATILISNGATHAPTGNNDQRLSTLRREATRLQKMGLNPIPIRPILKGRKAPFVKKGELKDLHGGLYYRRSDTADNEEWARRTARSTDPDWRWENLALVTGRTSNAFTVDIDHETAWKYLNMLGVYDHTATWKWGTGRGTQMAFKIPQGLDVPNFHGAGRLLRDVPFDIKGDKGFAVVPPSVHHTGRKYRYADGFAPWECSLAEAPSRFVAAICLGLKNGQYGTGRAISVDLPSEVVNRIRTKDGRLDALRTQEPVSRTEISAVPASRNFQEQLSKVKRLFFEYDIPVSPILERSRKTTLLSRFRRITRNREIEPEELRRYLLMANNTLCYDEEGKNLFGLEERELDEILDEVTKNLPEKSSPEVQNELTALRDYLALVFPKLKRSLNTDAKVVRSLAGHGLKYGGRQGEKLRVEVSKDILRSLGRIRNEKTLNRSLKRMKGKGGIDWAREPGARTNHYLLDLKRLMSEEFWGISGVSNPKGGVSNGDSLVSSKTPPPPLGLKPSEREYEETIMAILHTTHHGGVGDAAVRQVVAFLELGGTERNPIHTQDLADELDVTRGSIYKTLKELRERGIVELRLVGRGYYGLTEDFLDGFHKMRKEKGEFEKDGLIRDSIEENRKMIAYEEDLFRAARRGKDLDLVPVPVDVPLGRVLNTKAKILRRNEREESSVGFGERIKAARRRDTIPDQPATHNKYLAENYGPFIEQIELVRINEGDERAATFAKERGYHHPEVNPDVRSCLGETG